MKGASAVRCKIRNHKKLEEGGEEDAGVDGFLARVRRPQNWASSAWRICSYDDAGESMLNVTAGCFVIFFRSSAKEVTLSRGGLKSPIKITVGRPPNR